MSIKGFNIGGTTYKVDYPELDNLPQINGNDLVGNLDAESLGLDQVYWAGYRWATNAEIEAALNDGKIVLCRVPNPLALLDPPVVCQLTQRNSATNHRFAAITTGAEILLYVAYCVNNSWTSGVFKLATDASVPDPNPNPAAPLGTASAGSSNTYSRGDHVHAMPSAEDVGAIRDPDTKSSGQVLTYNGYSWVARTPSGGGGGGEISDDLKAALLQIARKVAYIDSQGQTYYQGLYNALYPAATVVSISAVFNQGSAVICDTDDLDDLRQYLTVTATYDDSSTAVVTTYTLSGTLTTGTSTITVSFGGKTDTFNVTVSGYVMSGLVMWLDGEKNSTDGNHVSSVTTWVDQSGNGWDFDNVGATVNAKSLSFNGTSQYLKRAYDSLPHDVKMMEIVVNRTSGNNVISGFGNIYPGNITFGGTKYLSFQIGTGTGNGKNAGFNLPDGLVGTVISANSAGYINGTSIATQTDSNDWQYRYPCIGGYLGSGGTNFQYGYKGEIYCIRMYNRILTEQEILANYAVDAHRFGIGG